MISMDKIHLYKKAAEEFIEVTKVFDSLVKTEETQVLALRDELKQTKKELAELKDKVEQEKKKHRIEKEVKNNLIKEKKI